MNQGLEQSDTDSFQDSSLKLNVRSGQSRSSSLLSESSSQPEIHPFFKDSYGKFIVLYSYHGQDENDLSVERGQLVTVLNKVTTADVSPRSIISPDECVCWMGQVPVASSQRETFTLFLLHFTPSPQLRGLWTLDQAARPSK